MNEQRPYIGPGDDPSDEHEETTREPTPGIGDHIKSMSTWLRLLFMFVMLLLYGISRIVVLAVVLIQFCYALFTGAAHAPLTRFGRSLAAYTYEIVLYLTYASQSRPFPFDNPWPGGMDISDDEVSGHSDL